MKKNIILSAFNIHTGGGFVLIKDLLKSNLIKVRLLDSRIKNKINFKLKNTFFSKREIIERVYKFHKLCFLSKKNNKIICLNGLPPFLFKPKAKVILFIQTFYFFSKINYFTNIKSFRFSLLVFLRIKLEQLWFRLGIKNADEIWLQTPTMKKRFIKYLYNNKIKKKFTIKILPYLDKQSMLYFDKFNRIEKNNVKKNLFIYPADHSGHKNHTRLLNAFSKVKRDFKLYLTLENKKFDKLLKKINLNNDTKSKIENLGQISRKELFSIYKNKVGTLIFPSIDESFGLPLIEAALLKKNILVSNHDYHKDILSNAITFNPFSISSIEKTIKKFLDKKKIINTKLKNINFIDSKIFLIGGKN